MTSQQFPIDAILSGEYAAVPRAACVRIGIEWGLHTATNHASLGITDVTIENENLVVWTDFDETKELCMGAYVTMDSTLAMKGVDAGSSGGSNKTVFTITSTKTLNNSWWTGGAPTVTKAAGVKISPASSVFNSAIDNLWIHFWSLRKVSSCPPVTEGAS